MKFVILLVAGCLLAGTSAWAQDKPPIPEKDRADGDKEKKDGGSDRRGRRRGEREGVNPKYVEAAKVLRARRGSDNLPGIGAAAPDFHLKLLEGSTAPDFVEPDAEGRVKLSDHKQRKPVVLIFGSYT